MANGFVNRYSYPRVSVSVQTSVRTSNVLSIDGGSRFSYPLTGNRTNLFLSNRMIFNNKSFISVIENNQRQMPDVISEQISQSEYKSFPPITITNTDTTIQFINNPNTRVSLNSMNKYLI
jgi:hypothetical protein